MNNLLNTLFVLSFIGFTFAQVCSDVNEEYKECGTACPRSCADPRKNRMCIQVCKSGCFCKDPYIRDQSTGKCVLLEKCAKTCTHDHESFAECGSACPLTCDNFNQTGRVCPAVCVEGCFCEMGFVRDNSGKCVLTKDCPQKSFDEGICEDSNAVYTDCGTACPKTCANRDQNIICTKQCVSGCFCKPGYVKDSKSGKCVLTRDCPQTIKSFDGEMCEDKNSVYTECGTACPKNCANRNKNVICTEQCVRGCFCKSGYVKSDNSKSSKCVLTRDCPQRDDGVCTENAVFKQCGTACPITCKNHLNPPKICTMQCVAGCFCQSPYIKDQSTGKCVLPDACPSMATTFSTTSV